METVTCPLFQGTPRAWVLMGPYQSGRRAWLHCLLEKSPSHPTFSLSNTDTPKKNKRLGDDLLHLRTNQEFLPHFSLICSCLERKQASEAVPVVGQQSERRGYSLPTFEIPFFLFPRALEAKDNPEFSKEIHWNKSHSSLLSFFF